MKTLYSNLEISLLTMLIVFFSVYIKTKQAEKYVRPQEGRVLATVKNTALKAVFPNYFEAAIS